MKLWLISQTQNDGYDTYDSAVVAAETEEQARKMSPSRYYANIDGTIDEEKANDSYGVWTSFEHVSVKLIGEAVEGTSPGPILGSFNAG